MEQLASLPTPPFTVEIEVEGEISQKLEVIQLDEKLFRANETTDLWLELAGGFLFLFGDTFEADKITESKLKFLGFQDTTSFRHILWDGNLLCDGKGFPKSDEDREQRHRNKMDYLETNFATPELLDKVMAVGGMWEVDGVMSTLISIHYPTEYEQEILGNIASLAPNLSTLSCSVLTGGKSHDYD